jgi:hypothetical protein
MTDMSTGGASAQAVEFVDYHRPALESGTYSITVEQAVKGPRIATEQFKTVQSFRVAGERFALKPADIYAVFPPADSLGDHSMVLPHIALNRSTLPWEQDADGQRSPLAGAPAVLRG